MKFAHTYDDEHGANVTVYIDGRVLTADGQHPNYPAIVEAILAEDADVPPGFDREAYIVGLFDIPLGISRIFQHVSRRVTVRGGQVFVDGDPARNAVVNAIVDAMSDGDTDFMPFVRFLEKIEENPNEHSREEAWGWLESHRFTITDQGDILGYKGLRHAHRKTVDDRPVYVSGQSGHAIVNGIEYGADVEGEEPGAHHVQIPQSVGDVVEMPRSEVVWAPGDSCHVGLHVATHNFAQSYGASGAVCLVAVHPADICSVPNGGEKFRCCRYEILDNDGGEVDRTIVRVQLKEQPTITRPGTFIDGGVVIEGRVPVPETDPLDGAVEREAEENDFLAEREAFHEKNGFIDDAPESETGYADPLDADALDAKIDLTNDADLNDDVITSTFIGVINAEGNEVPVVVTGAEIRERRKALGWSTRKLAKHAGVSKSVVGQIERGERGLGGRSDSGLTARLLFRTLVDNAPAS